MLLRSDCAIALAELDGTPVAGALVVVLGDDPAGYVGWVACADEARGRGLGDVVTRAVTNEAFDRGARLVTLARAEQSAEAVLARVRQTTPFLPPKPLPGVDPYDDWDAIRDEIYDISDEF